MTIPFCQKIINQNRASWDCEEAQAKELQDYVDKTKTCSSTTQGLEDLDATIKDILNDTSTLK